MVVTMTMMMMVMMIMLVMMMVDDDDGDHDDDDDGDGDGDDDDDDDDDDDEKFKLGLFAHAAMGVAVPGQHMYPGVLPVPMQWFTTRILMIIGYMFGWGMANTEYEFKGLKQAFAGGMADTGDLIPKAIDAARAATGK